MARSFLGKLKRGLFMTHTEFLEKAGEALRRTGPVDQADLDRLEQGPVGLAILPGTSRGCRDED